MKKIFFAVAVLCLSVSAVAFASGSTSAKEKAYGDCVVKAPKVCGGAENVDWSNPEQAAKFRECTSVEYKKCYDAYVSGK